ncbi:hypothetical protein Pan110_55520 [Gimesia panareensis]|nr:hypothetical protein Pan110_55520 [Gimesia panareensis]
MIQAIQNRGRKPGNQIERLPCQFPVVFNNPELHSGAPTFSPAHRVPSVGLPDSAAEPAINQSKKLRIKNQRVTQDAIRGEHCEQEVAVAACNLSQSSPISETQGTHSLPHLLCDLLLPAAIPDSIRYHPCSLQHRPVFRVFRAFRGSKRKFRSLNPAPATIADPESSEIPSRPSPVSAQTATREIPPAASGT